MKKKTRKKKDDNSDNDAEQENKPQVNGNVRTLENLDLAIFMYCPFFDPKQSEILLRSYWELKQTGSGDRMQNPTLSLSVRACR